MCLLGVGWETSADPDATNRDLRSFSTKRKNSRTLRLVDSFIPSATVSVSTCGSSKVKGCRPPSREGWGFSGVRDLP